MSEEIKAYMLSRPESREDFPFGPEVSVMKIRDKMFATYSANKDGPARINLKCEPAEALMLRDVFESVIPGYHMNKKHWNTVILDGTVPRVEIERMIDRSYGLVVKKLNRTERQYLERVHGEEALYR